MGRITWRNDEGLLTSALYRRDLHQATSQGRGIQQKEIAQELGVSKDVISRYFADGGDEELADQVDRAITAISDRRGLAPERVVWPTSGLWPDGLPEVFTPEDEYRRELTMRDLMRAPGRDL